MKYQIKYPFIFAVSFFWLGLVIAVSFLETPLKFQVPGMTLPIALELGKTMFGISTNIQLGLMILVFFNLFLNPSKLNKFIICTGIFIRFDFGFRKILDVANFRCTSRCFSHWKGTPTNSAAQLFYLRRMH